MALYIIKNDSKELTPGEQKLLNKIKKLYETYKNNAYLYVQPTISSLIPDFILIDEKRGISILEVKDWSLSYIKDVNKRRVILNDREDDNPINKTKQYYNICNGIISDNDKIYHLNVLVVLLIAVNPYKSPHKIYTTYLSVLCDYLPLSQTYYVTLCLFISRKIAFN